MPHDELDSADLRSCWKPFTSNRYFQQHPHLIVGAAGPFYRLQDGREAFDCLSGLWCCPLGHGHRKVTEAVQRQVATLDYSPAFQVGHPGEFELAQRILARTPPSLQRVFFANSGSEAVDTALKIAIGFHRMRGEASRVRIIGRERGYHGVGIGGTSVGGMVANRRMFAPLMMPHVDHLPQTYDPQQAGYSRGQPTWGAHLADELERLVALHDPSTVAAVIIEPMQGSAGVIVPPQGYLERIREICTRHGILLIFDEVITGFGRLGTSFGAQRFGVVPDLLTFAKAVTNGVVPLGGVAVRGDIYESFMQGPEHGVEFFHGYTYSGHPLACATGVAALDAFEEEGLFERARELEPVLENAVHSLRGDPLVVDVRNIGLAAAVDLLPIEGAPGLRARRVFEHGLERGILVRFTGDTIALAPPFIATRQQIESMVDILRSAIRLAG